jgi:transcriptional regulator with XRE-family HTH domain
MSVKAMARAVGLAESTIYDLERSDSDSSTKLHLFAKALGLNVHWLETGKGQRLLTDAPASVREEARVYALPISPEEADIGREWGKLDEPQRSAIAEQIHLLVAAQKRGAFGKTRADKSKKQRPDEHPDSKN